MISRHICMFAAAIAISLAPSWAAARSGIAYVEAPELSSGVCLGGTAQEAFDCAKKQCIDGGGTAEDCMEIAYCFPARWSVDVFVQSSEGNHWHEFYCGWENRAMALQAAKTACNKKLRQGIMECQAVMIHDEDGNQEDVTK